MRTEPFILHQPAPPIPSRSIGGAMDPIWYTIRIVATVVMRGIGALLLWAA